MGSEGAIGIFDSGYGGLTVFRSIADLLPEYDFIYLGDNARAPYGNRSFETIYRNTWECVRWMMRRNSPLIILACNTASAKALKNIQINQLPMAAPDNRVLGVIRPTAEVIANYTKTGAVGILGTKGTIASRSYEIEIAKLHPHIRVVTQTCPMWVPLVEYGEYRSPGADYFIQKYLDELFSENENIDTLLLACTHYPLLLEKIAIYTPPDVRIISQGPIVAQSLQNYLERHPEINNRLAKSSQRKFYTTDVTGDFDAHAFDFFGEEVRSEYIRL